MHDTCSQAVYIISPEFSPVLKKTKNKTEVFLTVSLLAIFLLRIILIPMLLGCFQFFPWEMEKSSLEHKFKQKNCWNGKVKQSPSPACCSSAETQDCVRLRREKIHVVGCNMQFSPRLFAAAVDKVTLDTIKDGQLLLIYTADINKKETFILLPFKGECCQWDHNWAGTGASSLPRKAP